MQRHAPMLGEHSNEILEELGFDPETLRSQGVIG
jgi:crotonobetainyl-CoA:carnitine CoA-transferase CaiB-like acyl-CoA transferase